MQFTSILLTAIASTAFANPIARPAAELEVRDGKVQLIDLWQSANFLDLKFTGSSTVGTCENLPNNFNNFATSGKAKPGFRCTVWVDKNCDGTGFSFDVNGKAQFPDWIDNKSSSWKCVKA